MEKILRVTNALLAVIALCLVLLVASVYRVNVVPVANAQTGTSAAKPQPVYLVYWDHNNRARAIVGADGKLPTK